MFGYKMKTTYIMNLAIFYIKKKSLSLFTSGEWKPANSLKFFDLKKLFGISGETSSVKKQRLMWGAGCEWVGWISLVF